MSIKIKPLNQFFGAEIAGVDLSRPLEESAWDEIRQAFLDYSILLFRDQHLSKAEHVAFSRRFGDLEIHVVRENTDPEHPEIFLLGNVEEAGGGKPFLSNINESWHSDSSFLAEPSTASLLYCRIAPMAGGDTMLASARAAYNTLPIELKRRIQGRTALYSYNQLHQKLLEQEMPGVKPMSDAEKARYPDVRHPLVRLNPDNGTRSIYVCETSTRNISSLSDEQTETLVVALCDHITRAEAVYRHHWRVGDLLIWDNRCTMHAATAFDPGRNRRLLHRTTVAGGRPILAPPEEI